MLPVTGIVEPPHRWSDWRVLVSVVFTEPGRYYLYLLKVEHAEGGRRYWDYLGANIPVRAISPKTDPALSQPSC